MSILKMSEIALAGKTVLIRQDLNVPVKNGCVQSDQRIRASLPTIQEAVGQGAAVIIMSHLGRPNEGSPQDEFTLLPVAKRLQELLEISVTLNTNYLEVAPKVNSGEIILLENVRFNLGESVDDDVLAKRYAEMADVFVMDAFGSAHRAQASTHGVAKYADIACAGPLLDAELDALGRSFNKPNPPTVAIVGGAKVSTKLTVLKSLSEKVDVLIPGGGIANTFIKAMGYDVGKSLYEPDLVNEAKSLIEHIENTGKKIMLPADVVVGNVFSDSAVATAKSLDAISAEDMIFDVGPATQATYQKAMQQAGTILWNGPVGVFEFNQFSDGTRVLGEAIASSDAFSIAGGGDTLAAVDKFNLSRDISYISTGGGAFLEFLEGKTLPAVEILEKKAAQQISGSH